MHCDYTKYPPGKQIAAFQPGCTFVSSPAPASSPEAETIPDDRQVLSIAVVDNAYSYENKRMDLDTLTRLLTETEPGFVVAITDDNASLQAYNRLTDTLDSLSLAYIE